MGSEPSPPVAGEIQGIEHSLADCVRVVNLNKAFDTVSRDGLYFALRPILLRMVIIIREYEGVSCFR